MRSTAGEALEPGAASSGGSFVRIAPIVSAAESSAKARRPDSIS
jgi:hypothetical protein